MAAILWHHVIKAKNVTAVAARTSPRMSPAEFLELPVVLQENAKLTEGRSGLEAEIADSHYRSRCGLHQGQKAGTLNAWM